MLDIEVLCSSRELFGADRAALRLCEVLGSLGHHATLVLPADRPEGGMSAFAASRGVATADAHIALATSSGLEQSRAMLGRLRRTAAPDLTILSSASILGTNRAQGRRVLILQEWLNPSDPKHRALAAWHAARSSAVVTISYGVARQWRRTAPVRRSSDVIWHWLDNDLMASAAPSVDEPLTRHGILCVGRFNHWKGQELLAAAFAKAFDGREQRPELTFLGHQPGTQFEARGKALEAAGADHGWTVRPFEADPMPFMRRACLLVVPSLQPEPFGLVNLEGLAAGCLVLATTGGGPADLSSHFSQALRTVERDPDEMAAFLSEWWRGGGHAQDPETFAGTRATLVSTFSPSAAVQRWRILLDRLG
jgi:glycosyltransferase involved in cell wall biosynthesis